jgi:hypothetical protein
MSVSNAKRAEERIIVAASHSEAGRTADAGPIFELDLPHIAITIEDLCIEFSHFHSFLTVLRRKAQCSTVICAISPQPY